MIGLAILLAAAAPADAPDMASDATLALALRAVEHGRPLQARVMLDRLETLKIATDPLVVTRIRAKLALTDRDYPHAEERFEQLLVKDANDCDALEGAGIAAAHLAHDEPAQAHLQRAVAHCILSWQGWNTLGVIADRAGLWTDAADAYAHAHRIAPDEPSIFNNMGYSLTLQRRFAEAEDVLRQARTLAPHDARFENNLDIATVAGGAPLALSDPAEPDAEQARRLNNAGYVALMEGRDQEAQTYLAASMDTAPRFSAQTANNLRLLKQGESDAH